MEAQRPKEETAETKQRALNTDEQRALTLQKEPSKGPQFTFLTKEKHVNLVKLPEKIVDETKFSSWTKLVRVTAFVKRYCDNLRNRKKTKREKIKITESKSGKWNQTTERSYKPSLGRVVPVLTPSEIEWAENHVLKTCQADRYPREYKALLEGRCVAPQSPLKKMRPTLDKNGVMCLSSRLRAAKYLNMDKRSPILLPKDDHLTSIIVWHHHIEVNKHVGGTGTTLSTLNKRYWLLGGRREVGKNLAKCTPCRRNNARPKPQEMAPLPRCRVHSQEVERITPIHKTGIDVAGPFKVNLGRGSATWKKSETQHLVDVFPSNKDHHIRRARVKYKNKIIDRSLSRLMVIQEAPPQV